MTHSEEDKKFLEGMKNGVVDCRGRSIADVYAQLQRLFANPEQHVELPPRVALEFSVPSVHSELTYSSDIPLRVVSREEARSEPGSGESDEWIEP